MSTTLASLVGEQIKTILQRVASPAVSGYTIGFSGRRPKGGDEVFKVWAHEAPGIPINGFLEADGRLRLPEPLRGAAPAVMEEERLWMRLSSGTPEGGSFIVVIHLGAAAKWIRSQTLRSQIAARAIPFVQPSVPVETMAPPAPNKAAIQTLLGLRIAAKQGGALVVIDLDRFARLNESTSKEACDQVLVAVGQLVESLGYPCGRLAMDEFAILLPDGTTTDIARNLATQLQSATAELVDQATGTRTAGCAAGIVVFSAASSRSADHVLRAAIRLVHQARENASVYVSDSEQQQRALRFFRGLAAKRFVYHYQPIFDLSTHQPVLHEALVRYRRDDGGVDYPDSFLPAVENSALSYSLDRYTLDAAIDTLEYHHCRGIPLRLSVNISARSLGENLLTGALLERLRTAAIPADSLVIEITEAAMIQDPDAARANLAQVRAAGAKIALDDFGAGHHSYDHLLTLPLDYLKIDSKLVLQIGGSPTRLRIVEHLVGIALDLGLTPIAEGTENPAQLDLLQGMGVTLGQGFLLARPQPEIFTPPVWRQSAASGA